MGGFVGNFPTGSLQTFLAEAGLGLFPNFYPPRSRTNMVHIPSTHAEDRGPATASSIPAWGSLYGPCYAPGLPSPSPGLSRLSLLDMGVCLLRALDDLATTIDLRITRCAHGAEVEASVTQSPTVIRRCRWSVGSHRAVLMDVYPTHLTTVKG